MPEKRVFPLNNPLPQKRVDHQLINTKLVVVKGVEGVRQGGEGETEMTTEEMVQEYLEMCQRVKGEVLPVYMLLRCRQCGQEQQITFAYWKPSKWHRCIGCKELQPTQGFAVIAHANYPLG